MRVATVMGFGSWWGQDLPPDVLDRADIQKTVGGGEEAVLETALQLRLRGHDVDLWWYGQPGTWRGLQLRSLHDDLYGRLLREDYDAVVAWSTIAPLEAVRRAGKRARTFLAQQLNDLLLFGDWSCVDCVISPSESHAQQLPSWGWRQRPYAVVHNGLRLERHADAPPWSSRPLHVGYWSSPDRGLHHLLRAWPEVVKAEPTAHLHVFYEIERYLLVASPSPGPLGERARILTEEGAKATALPSVTFHGAVPRAVLAPIQNNCRVQCYPYQPVMFCEGFCGAVNQGIAAGCHVLTTPHDALPSLYADKVTWLPKATTEMMEALPAAILKALHTPPPGDGTTPFTWEAAGEEMERALSATDWKVTNAL